MSSIATFTLAEYDHMIACRAFVGPNAKIAPRSQPEAVLDVATAFACLEGES